MAGELSEGHSLHPETPGWWCGAAMGTPGVLLDQRATLWPGPVTQSVLPRRSKRCGSSERMKGDPGNLGGNVSRTTGVFSQDIVARILCGPRISHLHSAHLSEDGALLGRS